MSFNPDPTKQAVEVTFSKKKISVDHPPIFFNDVTVMKVDEHKHLGVVLDSRLTFSSHIQTAINKARRGIGMLRFLSNYLPRQTLNELYKLYVRLHLDYGDVIYQIPQKVCDFSHEVTLHRLMERLESVFIFIHFKFFIHGGPINQEWLLFRGPWKKPSYNATKIKKNIYNVKFE